jgi:hypothetical protein
MEKKVHRLYDHALKRLEEQLGSGVTYGGDLNRVGKQFLGKKFVGVYPADMLPMLSKRCPYAILNLDNSDMPGSHWIAVKYMGRGASDEVERCLVYDSFGRKTQRIIPSLAERYATVDADDDAEQENREDNCGSRSLAFLIIDDVFGSKMSRKI